MMPEVPHQQAKLSYPHKLPHKTLGRGTLQTPKPRGAEKDAELGSKNLESYWMTTLATTALALGKSDVYKIFSC